MPSRCVVYGCSNIPDPANSIILHKIPYDGDLRSEAIKRRKVWVDFVKRKRAKWEPSSSSCVCSKHFKAGDFQRILNLAGQQETYRPVLKRDDIGITSFPSVYTTNETEKQLSDRAARAIKRKFSTAENEPSTSEELQPGCSSDFVEPEAEMDLDMPSVECHDIQQSETTNEKFTQTVLSAEVCKCCLELEERNRLLRNQKGLS
ncbi:THAP domain-containing protein 2-like [Dendronephthya gigantea]|uniref:THAP domain-containing protein 2-like n=1 Tax=Dendronephthya gigantea TaxID=151771 RepID=UPI001069DD66|nr:THAP domain-containing protein 2-like [Dendronephthya gigantea]